MSDIVERLKDANGELLMVGNDFSDPLLDAAKEIESLRKREKDLQQALLDAAASVIEIGKELAALKQSQGEPVAYIHKWKLHAATMGRSLSFQNRSPHGDDMEIIPLYTSPTIPEGKMLIETAFLKMVSESLGRFVSDEGWAQHDMDVMDDLDARIAAAPKP